MHTVCIHLQQRKPVQQLTAVSAQKRLLALVDGTLYLMNMITLELYDTGQRVAKVMGKSTCTCTYIHPSRGNVQ